MSRIPLVAEPPRKSPPARRARAVAVALTSALALTLAGLALAQPAGAPAPTDTSAAAAAPAAATRAAAPPPAPRTPEDPANDPATGSTASKAGTVLFTFFVLSIVFEAALTPIFNWRVFLARFEGRGLSSLLIAGGSDGRVNIYTKLGIRNPVERERRTVEARADRARTLEAEAFAEPARAVRNAADPVAAVGGAGPVIDHAVFEPRSNAGHGPGGAAPLSPSGGPRSGENRLHNVARSLLLPRSDRREGGSSECPSIPANRSLAGSCSLDKRVEARPPHAADLRTPRLLLCPPPLRPLPLVVAP